MSQNKFAKFNGNLVNGNLLEADGDDSFKDSGIPATSILENTTWVKVATLAAVAQQTFSGTLGTAIKLILSDVLVSNSYINIGASSGDLALLTLGNYKFEPYVSMARNGNTENTRGRVYFEDDSDTVWRQDFSFGSAVDSSFEMNPLNPWIYSNGDITNVVHLYLNQYTGNAGTQPIAFRTHSESDGTFPAIRLDVWKEIQT